MATHASSLPNGFTTGKAAEFLLSLPEKNLFEVICSVFAGLPVDTQVKWAEQIHMSADAAAHEEHIADEITELFCGGYTPADASAEAKPPADDDWGTLCSVSFTEATTAEAPSVKAPAKVEEKSKAEAPIADVCGHYLTIGLNCRFPNCTKLHPSGLENSVKPLKSLKTKKEKKKKAKKPCWYFLTEGQNCQYGSGCRNLHPSGKENSQKPKASAADDAAS